MIASITASRVISAGSEQTVAAVGPLEDLDDPGPGKLLGDLGEEIRRNLRLGGDLLSADQRSLAMPGKVQDAAYAVFTGACKSHGQPVLSKINKIFLVLYKMEAMAVKKKYGAVAEKGVGRSGCLSC
jgi:hypothetical protein